MATLAVPLVAAFVTLGGCGNLSAGGFGELSVSMSGDAPDATGGAEPSGLVAAAESTEGRDDPEGELEAEFLLALVGPAGPVSLNSEPLRLKLDVEGEQEVDALTATVPAGRYSALRVVFTDFEVEIDSGLIINGVPVVGDIEVELEDGTLQVERSIPLVIIDGDRVALLVDLNAATWLQSVDPDLRTVAETLVGSAITVVVR